MPSLLAALLVALAAGPGLAATPRDVEDHRRAIALARDGKLEPAITLLEQIRRRAPDFAPAAHDSVIVLGWAGRHADALRLFDRLPAPVPTYVVGAAARSARDMRDYDRAVTLYRDAAARERREPGGDQTPFVAGEIMALADADRFDAAIRRADADIRSRRRTADVLEAAAYAEQRKDRPFDALSRTDGVLQIDPERRESLRRRVFLLDRVGAPERALELAEARRKLFSAAEIRSLEGDVAAAMVRRGSLPSATEAERFAATDAAIARLDTLIERWRAEGSETAADVRRARLDRIVALRDRVRMRELVEEYEALGGDELPAYIRKAAASAYLYLRQPERARDIYRSVLRESPEDFDATVGLIYALLETNGYEEALALTDELDRREGVWLWLRGAVEPEPNERKLDTESLAASLRLYTDQLVEAQQRFERMSSLAPHNARLRAGLANTYLARGWPRRARAETEHGLAHEPEDRDLALAQGNALLRTREWRAADAMQAELGRRFPEDLNVQRLQRDWQISQMAELRIVAAPTYSQNSGSNVSDGSGFEIETVLFAPPIDYVWRPFATARLAQARPQEGTILLRQLGAGIEWRQSAYEAVLQTSLAEYGPTKGGLRAALGWLPDDQWSFTSFGEIFATDTPMRALKNGITANAIGLSSTWRRDESLSVRGAVQALDFSDGNLRLDLGLRGQTRVYTEPRLTVDVGMTFGLTANSDPGGPYYAPRRAASAVPEVAVQQILQQRYETVWSHRFVVGPGVTWEQDYGAAFTPEIRYEHRWRPSDTLELGIIGRYGNPVYDGDRERFFALTFELNWKF